MAGTNQDLDTRSKKQCPWSKAPATGTTIEGLLFCVVGLYMVVTVALPLYRGATTNADTPGYEAVATTTHNSVFASAHATVD
jgi:hypothetical protein